MPLLRKSFSLAGISKRITMFNNAISHTIGDVILEEVPGNVGASSIRFYFLHLFTFFLVFFLDIHYF